MQDRKTLVPAGWGMKFRHSEGDGEGDLGFRERNWYWELWELGLVRRRTPEGRPREEWRRAWRWQNWGPDMVESQSLETHLNFIRDLAGSRRRISSRRSALPAMNSAEDDGGGGHDFISAQRVRHAGKSKGDLFI